MKEYFYKGPIKAVIFDLDGLIIDSEPLHRRSFNEILKPFHVHISLEDWRNIVGHTLEEAAKRFISQYNLPVSADELSKQKITEYKSSLEELELRPGIIELLDLLDSKIAVTTQSRLKTLTRILKKFNLNKRFDVIVSSKELGIPKPAPDSYLHTAKQLGIDVEHCLVLEDSITGVTAAKAAGMKCFAIPCAETAHQDFSIADERLDSLSEVYPLISKIPNA